MLLASSSKTLSGKERGQRKLSPGRTAQPDSVVVLGMIPSGLARNPPRFEISVQIRAELVNFSQHLHLALQSLGARVGEPFSGPAVGLDDLQKYCGNMARRPWAPTAAPCWHEVWSIPVGAGRVVQGPHSALEAHDSIFLALPLTPQVPLGKLPIAQHLSPLQKGRAARPRSL